MDNIMDRHIFLDPLDMINVLHDNSSDDDSDASREIPALEPITTNIHQSSSTENTAQDAIVIPSSSSAIHDSSSAANQAAFPSQSSAAIDAAEDNDDDDDDEPMPDLLYIGDLSSDDDTDEVEAMQDLQPVDDDNDNNSTDSDNEENMPPLEPIQPNSSSPRNNNRRARVDDDDDQDRDRRHPSQRVAGTTNLNANQPPTPSIPFQIRIPALVRIVPTPRTGVVDPSRRPQNATPTNPGAMPHRDTPNQRPTHRATPIFTGGFAFTLGAGPNPLPVPTPGGDPRNPPTEPGNPRPFDAPPTMGGFATDIIDLNTFANIIGRFGVDLGQALGLDREEQEDPERAKKLVDALEDVPVGLVRRLEQVGGAPGSHVDETAVDTPGCAICWDQLLDVEGVGFGFTNKTGENHAEGVNQEEAITQARGAQEVTHTDPSTASSSPSTSVSPGSPDSRQYPKIVSLPCAHVFHASCLIPWFSRPNQTTCPTCRFNVDPENLTYVRRPNPPMQTNPQPATQNTPTAPSNPPPEPANPGDASTSTPAVPPPEGASSQTQPPTSTTPPDSLTNPDTPRIAPTSPPLNLPFDGGMWTFGIDLVIEQSIPRGGEGPGQNENQSQGGQREQANQDAMDVDNPADMGQTIGEMRRESEALAEQLLGRLGFNMANANAQPTPGNATNPAPTPTAPDATGEPPSSGVTSQQAGPPLTGFPPIFPGGPNIPIFPVPLGPEFMAPGGPFTQPLGPHPRWHNLTPLFTTGNPPPPGSHRQQTTHREKKVWSLPPAPGPTLRQRVEQKEREVGFRCCDTSCGIGPSDEEPHVKINGAMKQLHIRPSKQGLVDGSEKTETCAHTFHPACLVSAERVAMQGAEEYITEGEVEVSCPVCRAMGCITLQQWKEGVSALL